MLTSLVRTALRIRLSRPETTLVPLLLALCLARGLWFAGGLPVPTDADTVRDIGFIQGVVDGNWFGDPAIAGAWRWYPPLIHWLAGLGFRLGALLGGGDVLSAWPRMGLWLNLAVPVTFLAMNRALFGAGPAMAATAVLVLFNGGVMAADETVGYTPWTLTPALAWPFFFLAVMALHRHVPAQRFAGAIAIGVLLGLVFLAHTVPALLLSGIAAAMVLATAGPTPRALAWVAVAGGVTLLVGMPFLGPLLLDYRLHIANPVPGAWVHPLLAAPDGLGRLLALNLPGVLAMASVWHMRQHLPRHAAFPALAAWIILCIVFLVRHYACQIAPGIGDTCRVFVIAPHHFHVYLQAAWASLIGLSLSLAYRHGTGGLRALLATGGAIVALLGTICVPSHQRDADARAEALAHPDQILDRSAYAWILRHTVPADRFVTLLPPEPDRMGSAAATVMAAGRVLVAPPEIHANPYVPWAPLNAHRLAWLDALSGGQVPCEPDGATTFALLPSGFEVTAPSAAIAVRSAHHVLYRIYAPACPPQGSGEGGEHFFDRLHLVAGGG